MKDLSNYKKLWKEVNGESKCLNLIVKNEDTYYLDDGLFLFLAKENELFTTKKECDDSISKKG